MNQDMESDQQLQIVPAAAQQVVPAEEGGDISPKRARITGTLAIPCDEDSFWRRIQETVAGAVSASIRPLSEGLSEVAARTSHNEEAMLRLQARFHEQLQHRSEQDSRIRARLDDL